MARTLGNKKPCLNFLSGKNLTVKISDFKTDLDKAGQIFYYRHALGHRGINVTLPNIWSIHGSH